MLYKIARHSGCGRGGPPGAVQGKAKISHGPPHLLLLFNFFPPPLKATPPLPPPSRRLVQIVLRVARQLFHLQVAPIDLLTLAHLLLDKSKLPLEQSFFSCCKLGVQFEATNPVQAL